MSQHEVAIGTRDIANSGRAHNLPIGRLGYSIADLIMSSCGPLLSKEVAGTVHGHSCSQQQEVLNCLRLNFMPPDRIATRRASDLVSFPHCDGARQLCSTKNREVLRDGG
jgi:hypothetical protein